MLPFHAGCRVTQAKEKEYHYECFCCQICTQPINGTFTVSTDGSKFQVSTHNQRSHVVQHVCSSFILLSLSCSSVAIVFNVRQHHRLNHVLHVVKKSTAISMVV
jgi:hypothetical protein